MNSPLYRLFKVILFIFYAFVVLLSILAGIIVYSDRAVSSATVVCKDGTSWNATKIYDDDYALCGVCTQRSSGGTKYNDCSYENMDYSSYTLNKQYEGSIWIILVPIIVFFVGAGIVDGIKLTIIYIITGKVDSKESLVVKLCTLPLGHEKEI